MPKKIQPKRGWRHCGWVPGFSFDKLQEKELRKIKDEDSFISDIEFAVKRYLVARDHHFNQPNKREVSAALDEIDDSLSTFLLAIANLDDRTSEHIKLCWLNLGGKKDDLSRFLRPTRDELYDLNTLHNAVKHAKRHINDIPDRSTKGAPRILTAIVAEVFNSYNLPIKKSENGDFNRCLSIAAYEEKSMTLNWVKNWFKESSES
ncbi:MAG: hypothetical protein N0E58_19465 [Candidatus Thiodiazotropha endolucinida]|uniref:Uncharacterized protein n=1 Tax=Candidatus Thiodiazotropha taylori TaxID=2792791 RepID=A0A9E4NN99_9GAMM|nr:hypothetical protein [Candidatus Thiodiazotropha taylori]MCW4238430.1 hypothetical protein [Candidatus Thiodiazotropha endolucinida]